MKKYLIPTIAVLLVLVVAWTAFGQSEQRNRQRGNMRERFQNMSEEERAKMRQRGGPRGSGFMGGQGQEEAIKTIEEQLAKLKAAKITRPQGSFPDLSEEERAQFREKMTKVFQDRQKILQTIIAQVARLQGRRQPSAGGGQFLLINTSDLKPIQEAAKKEKAEETTQLLQRLVARGSSRGFGGRGPGSGQRPQGGQRGGREKPQGGQRGGRERPQGGQGGGRQRNR
ncbi:MAG: hypothetical protein ACYS17_01600 [Planctomycetota bacterium]